MPSRDACFPWATSNGVGGALLTCVCGGVGGRGWRGWGGVAEGMCVVSSGLIWTPVYHTPLSNKVGRATLEITPSPPSPPTVPHPVMEFPFSNSQKCCRRDSFLPLRRIRRRYSAFVCEIFHPSTLECSHDFLAPGSRTFSNLPISVFAHSTVFPVPAVCYAKQHIHTSTSLQVYCKPAVRAIGDNTPMERGEIRATHTHTHMENDINTRNTHRSIEEFCHVGWNGMIQKHLKIKIAPGKPGSLHV